MRIKDEPTIGIGSGVVAQEQGGNKPKIGRSGLNRPMYNNVKIVIFLGGFFMPDGSEYNVCPALGLKAFSHVIVNSYIFNYAGWMSRDGTAGFVNKSNLLID